MLKDSRSLPPLPPPMSGGLDWGTLWNQLPGHDIPMPPEKGPFLTHLRASSCVRRVFSHATFRTLSPPACIQRIRVSLSASVYSVSAVYHCLWHDLPAGCWRIRIYAGLILYLPRERQFSSEQTAIIYLNIWWRKKLPINSDQIASGNLPIRLVSVGIVKGFIYIHEFFNSSQDITSLSLPLEIEKYRKIITL